jgi:hypothetical protein
MDYRGVLLVGLVSGAAIVGATTSCSGPDPGQVTFSERPRGSSGELTSGGTTSGGTDGGSTTDGGGTSSGGTDGGSSGVVADPVFGTTAFAAGMPGSGAPAKAANAAHAGDASGKNCVVAGCHLDARPWAFGGTLYSDTAGTARVAGAEIRISGPDGTEWAKTFSDVDGNFWLDAPGAPMPANSRVGVRTADGKKMNMSGAVGVAQAGCSQTGTCHGGTAGKVYIK